VGTGYDAHAICYDMEQGVYVDADLMLAANELGIDLAAA
jgi:hypothetical protein